MRTLAVVATCVGFFVIVHVFLYVDRIFIRRHAQRNARAISHHDLPKEP